MQTVTKEITDICKKKNVLFADILDSFKKIFGYLVFLIKKVFDQGKKIMKFLKFCFRFDQATI